MELRDFLKVLRRRWHLILACVLVAVGAAAALTTQMTPQYASTVRLFVSTPQTEGVELYQGGLFSEQRVTSYADLVTGPEIAERLVHDLGLDQTPDALREQISAAVIPKTVILRVTVTDPDPRRAERIVDALGQQFTSFVQDLETAPGSSLSPVKASVLGAPVTAREPVSPQPLRNVSVAALAGLLLGAGVAGMREALDTSIRTRDDLAPLTNAPALADMPFDPEAAKRRIVTDLDAQAPRVEAFRVLRTNLQFVNVDQPSKVFVVTSSVPEEGKTTTVCNLAITMAQAGHRVALVEGDLRRPKVAEYLGLEPAIGLTTVLIGRVDLHTALQPWGPADLSVLTSGEIPPDPAELLQSKAMAAVLAELQQSFDVVLIDAPPLLPVTDGALLSAQAHGALLVVRYGKTTRDQVRTAVERLTSVHGRVVGTVLNRCPARGAAGYGYKYGYRQVTAAGHATIVGRPASPAPTPPVGPRADQVLDTVGGRDDRWTGAT